MAEDVCELTDLPPSMCAHCRGHELEQPDDWATVGQPFEAGYGGRCPRCERGIEPGQRIARLADEPGYIHTTCPRRH